MDRVLDWLSSEFPPGWFDNTAVGVEWIAVVGACVSAYFAWRSHRLARKVFRFQKQSLGPRRTTRLEVMVMGDECGGPQGEAGYHKLVVKNRGPYPAYGLSLALKYRGSSDTAGVWVGDIQPRKLKVTGAAFRNYRGITGIATYRDGEDKLTEDYVKLNGEIYGPAVKNDEEIIAWHDMGKGWAMILTEEIQEWQSKRADKKARPASDHDA